MLKKIETLSIQYDDDEETTSALSATINILYNYNGHLIEAKEFSVTSDILPLVFNSGLN